MSATFEKVLQEARELPAAEQDLLIETLLTPQNDFASKEIEQAWLEESRHRLKAIQNGELGVVDAETALNRIEKKFNAHQTK